MAQSVPLQDHDQRDVDPNAEYRRRWTGCVCVRDKQVVVVNLLIWLLPSVREMSQVLWMYECR